MLGLCEMERDSVFPASWTPPTIGAIEVQCPSAAPAAASGWHWYLAMLDFTGATGEGTMQIPEGALLFLTQLVHSVKSGVAGEGIFPHQGCHISSVLPTAYGSLQACGCCS